MYTPWWLYGAQLAGKLSFPRGYHIEFGGGRELPGMGTASGLEWLTGGSYGRRFKDEPDGTTVPSSASAAVVR